MILLRDPLIAAYGDVVDGPVVYFGVGILENIPCSCQLVCLFSNERTRARWIRVASSDMRLETAWACETSFAKTVTLLCVATERKKYAIHSNEESPWLVNISDMFPLLFVKGIDVFFYKALFADLESASFWQLRFH